MKQRPSLRMAALSGLASALSTLAAAPVPAAPQIVGSHWSESQTCVYSGSCTMVFSTIPAGRKLLITDISCRAHHETTTIFIHNVTIDPLLSSSALDTYFAPNRIGISNGTSFYAFSAKANTLMLAGNAPRVRINLAGTGSTTLYGFCTLIGVYTTYP